MRIIVSRLWREVRTVTVIPSPASHLPPVQLYDKDKERLIERLLPEVERVQGASYRNPI